MNREKFDYCESKVINFLHAFGGSYTMHEIYPQTCEDLEERGFVERHPPAPGGLWVLSDKGLELFK